MTTDPLTLDEQTLTRLQAARRVVAFTGAGVSEESGIPTYRGAASSLWNTRSFKQYASPEGFARDPKSVWNWYALRRWQVLKVHPNAAHVAIAQLADYYPDLTVVTQNVDGLHARAGSANVIELHGSLYRFLCSQERRPVAYEDPREGQPLTIEAIERGEGPEPPVCPDCGAPLRPDVVWFGETVPVEAYKLAERAVAECDICLVVGTSALIYPAAALPTIARRAGALLVEVNPEVTSLSEKVDVSLRGKAGEVLPWLVAQITAGPPPPVGNPPSQPTHPPVT